MEIHKADRFLVRAGFLLFTLALLTGFAIPAFFNPRMAVAAHLGAVLNGLVLIAIGLTWGLLSVSPLQGKLTRGAFLYGAYVSWVAGCLAAAWGTNRMTPLAGAGLRRRTVARAGGAGTSDVAGCRNCCGQCVGGLRTAPQAV
jgi:hydroxylaminobenzene mutase